MFKRGYTLIELLIVIAIIGLVAVFAFPAYGSYRDTQIYRQRAEETRLLVFETFNLSRNPEPGVSNYLSIPDPDSKKMILAKQVGVNSIPETIREIAFDDGIECQTGGVDDVCGILYCTTEIKENLNDVCDLKNSNGTYSDLSDDISALSFSLSFPDSKTGKTFLLADLSGPNITEFETQGLRVVESSLP